MKKTQSEKTPGVENQSRETVRDEGQKEKSAEYPLPEPMELAKLAAMLGPTERPAEAIDAAIKFYVQAVLIHRRLPKNPDTLIRLHGTTAQSIEATLRPQFQEIEKQYADTLILAPKASTDPAREFLHTLGLKLKTCRAVLDNIRKSYSTGAEEMIREAHNKGDGKTYHFPKPLLVELAESAKLKRAESKRKGHATRRAKGTEGPSK